MEIEDYYKEHGIDPRAEGAYRQARGENFIDFPCSELWQNYYVDIGLTPFRAVPIAPEPSLPEPPKEPADTGELAAQVKALRAQVARLEARIRDKERTSPGHVRTEPAKAETKVSGVEI